MKYIQILTILAFILGVELLGSLGTFATIPNIPTWYQTLTKPPLNPPNFIFAPVWTVLFALMGIALYLVWQKGWKKKPVKHALAWFGIQFFFNILWSFLFFGMHSPVFGFVCIILLWGLILCTIQSFLKVEKTAGLLLIPYLVWVSFALYLNLGIMLLN